MRRLLRGSFLWRVNGNSRDFEKALLIGNRLVITARPQAANRSRALPPRSRPYRAQSVPLLKRTLSAGCRRVEPETGKFFTLRSLDSRAFTRGCLRWSGLALAS